MIDRYDIDKLQKALKLLTEVYEYNYKATNCVKFTNKMSTVINKLSNIIVEEESKRCDDF